MTSFLVWSHEAMRPNLARLWLSGASLGEGGFARVLWGKLGDGTDVACKLLLPMYCNGDDESYEARSFRREAQMLMRLRHGNIVTCCGLLRLPPDYPGLEGHGYQHPTWVLVLELCQGRHLGDLLWRQMNNPSTELYSTYDAVCWMHDVACALQHMHSASPQILHRDMKQENVLLSVGTGPDAGRLVAKVADFGLAKSITPAVHAVQRAPPAFVSSRQMAQPCSSDQTSVTTAEETVRSLRPRSWNSSPCAAQPCPSNADGPGLLRGLSQPPQLAADGMPGMTPEQLQGHNEPAYNLTGRCGSKVYMAPEVFKGEPYNEKADMFGFANLCYEVFSRTMLLEEYLRITTGSTELGSMEQQQELEHAYAVAVTEGHRPTRHACILSGIWEIIEACWRQDPRERPSSAAVVERLASIREALSPPGQGPSRYASPGLQQVVQRGRWWEAVQLELLAQRTLEQRPQQLEGWGTAQAVLLPPVKQHPSSQWQQSTEAVRQSVLGKRSSQELCPANQTPSPSPLPIRRRLSRELLQVQQLAAQAQQLAEQAGEAARNLQILQQELAAQQANFEQQALLQASQPPQLLQLQPALPASSPLGPAQQLVAAALPLSQAAAPPPRPASPGPQAVLQDLAMLQQSLLSMALPEGQQQVALAAVQQLAAVLQSNYAPVLPALPPLALPQLHGQQDVPMLPQGKEQPPSPQSCTPPRALHRDQEPLQQLVLPPEPPSPPLHEAHRSPQQQQQQQQALPALPCALLEPLLSPKQLAAMLRQQ